MLQNQENYLRPNTQLLLSLIRGMNKLNSIVSKWVWLCVDGKEKNKNIVSSKRKHKT